MAMDDRGGRRSFDVETELIETEILRVRPKTQAPQAQHRPPSKVIKAKANKANKVVRPALVSTEVLPARARSISDLSGSGGLRFAQVGRAGRVYEVGAEAVRSDPIAAALDEGFQCLIGLDFAAATQLIARAGEGGVCVLDGAGATASSVAALRSRGALPVVHHLPVSLGDNGDAGRTAARNRLVDQCVDAARKGFAGVLLDALDLRRPADERDAADLKRTIEAARSQAGHPTFSAILRGGDQLVVGHTWLVEQGLVSAVVFDGLTFRSNARARAGMRVTTSERRGVEARIARLRTRFPRLPLIAIDHTKDRAQAEQAKARARALGFDVSHVAFDDALHRSLSALTTVGMRDDDPTMPLGSLLASRLR